jgi:predicted transposase YbfD/YdcC
MLPLKARLLTGDALYCQREICRQVVGAGGHYLLIARENQATLYRDIELFFTEPPFAQVFAQAEQRGRHGDREETRRIRASLGLKGYLDWPRAEQVMMIERKTKRKGKVEREVRYAITSQDSRVGPARLLWQVRRHWSIENRLHYVRGVSFGEDASQVRKGAAPEVMAALRNAVIGILRGAGWANIAAALRHYAWRQDAVLALLGL